MGAGCLRDGRRIPKNVEQEHQKLVQVGCPNDFTCPHLIEMNMNKYMVKGLGCEPTIFEMIGTCWLPTSEK